MPTRISFIAKPPVHQDSLDYRKVLRNCDLDVVPWPLEHVNTPTDSFHLAARLVAPEESFYLLLNEEDARLAEQAFLVEDVHPEYQMLFGADPERLEPGRPVRLGPHDLAAMRRLGAEVELTAMEKSPLQHGPAFGIWDGGELVAMGATHLLVPGAAEIGNIATHPAHRRRGLARQVVAALVRAHRAQGRRVFLMVFQDNPAGVRLYTGLGFAPLRPMFLTRCRLSSASR